MHPVDPSKALGSPPVRLGLGQSAGREQQHVPSDRPGLRSSWLRLTFFTMRRTEQF